MFKEIGLPMVGHNSHAGFQPGKTVAPKRMEQIQCQSAKSVKNGWEKDTMVRTSIRRPRHDR